MIALFSYASSENGNHVTAKEEVGDHFKGINGGRLIHRVVRSTIKVGAHRLRGTMAGFLESEIENFVCGAYMT